MHKWTILVTILIIGIAVAVGAWFFVKISTENTAIDTSAGEERRTFLSFFGEQFGFTTPTSDTPFEPGEPGDTPAGPTFREVLSREKMLPVGNSMLAGLSFTTTSTTTATTAEDGTETTITLTEESVRFVERETGRISDLSLTSGGVRRISNTTIPRVHEALWGPNASFVALRYLAEDNETVETYVASLPTHWNPESIELEGVFFPRNILSLATSPSSNEIFYIVQTSDQAIGRLSNSSNSNQRGVFVSPLREWLAAWDGVRIMLTNKPSVAAVGVSQWLGENGSTARIISGSGLTALSNPSGTRVLYALGGSSNLRTAVLTINGQRTFELPVATLPEKCAWLDDVRLVCGIPNSIPTGIPDAWYQGRVSFTDTLWLIDTVTERISFLYAPEDTGARRTMDIIGITVSDDGSVISLINKKDLRGWVADITNNQ